MKHNNNNREKKERKKKQKVEDGDLPYKKSN